MNVKNRKSTFGISLFFLSLKNTQKTYKLMLLLLPKQNNNRKHIFYGFFNLFYRFVCSDVLQVACFILGTAIKRWLFSMLSKRSMPIERFCHDRNYTHKLNGSCRKTVSMHRSEFAICWSRVWPPFLDPSPATLPAMFKVFVILWRWVFNGFFNIWL